MNIANLATDTQIMELTREEALRVLATDSDLAKPENRALRELRNKYRKRETIDFSDIS